MFISGSRKANVTASKITSSYTTHKRYIFYGIKQQVNFVNFLFVFCSSLQRQLIPSDCVPSHEYPQYGFKATSCSNEEHDQAQLEKQPTRRVPTSPSATAKKAAKRLQYLRFNDKANECAEAPTWAMPSRHWISRAQSSANANTSDQDMLVADTLGLRFIELFDFVHWVTVS